MDVTPIIDSLNDPQRDAVTADSGNMLILAGAGSGKTRVLVHRIAWLTQVIGISPHSVMAVTFTNKAAGEMRARCEDLMGIPGAAMWIGTFHGLAHRLLRIHWQEAGLPQAFQILDADDQKRMVKRVIKNLELDETRWDARQAQWYINSKKDEGTRPQHIMTHDDFTERHLQQIYAAYEDACQRAGVIDFAEILLRCHEVLRDNEHLLQHYQQRFTHLLVDEFQDTNTVQYAWIRLLAGNSGSVFVVGDDDQSIYGWRGAKVENIQRFTEDFKDTNTIRLEQNYRSTATILGAANAVIANNSARMGKELWTDSGDGEPLILYAAFNEYDEAQFIVDEIQSATSLGMLRNDIALLYRSNTQSRVLEEMLLRESIPYKVYGGLRFFERKEIKDTLAYLRLCINRSDDASFERIVNFPTRGVGNQTLEALRLNARDQQMPMWFAAEKLLTNQILPTRAHNALKGFVNLITALSEQIEGMPMYEQVEHIIDHSGLLDQFKKEQKRDKKGEARVENLGELINAARNFSYEASTEESTPADILTAFLDHASLEAGDQQADAWEDCVQLMTMHSAKGLEFKTVFIVGLEEGLFPHMRSLEDLNGLEEERRLAYVGMTRAMEQLYLCYAERRRVKGTEIDTVPSRFISETPAELMREVRPRMQTSVPMLNRNYGSSAVETAEEKSGFALGQQVRHPKFGSGVVLNAEGKGPSARVQINFEEVGAKWLVVQYANLEHC